MRLASTLGLVAATCLLLTAGCNKTTVEGPAGKKLTVVKPADQTIKRAETNKVMVTITRTKFTDPVTVQFENLPAGVKVQESEMKIASGDNMANFTLMAEDAAALVSNHEVKVTVNGPDGMKATESFKLTVKDKT